MDNTIHLHLVILHVFIHVIHVIRTILLFYRRFAFFTPTTTMTSAKPINCLYCKTRFQPKRRNQRYCREQCRIDLNNEKAKQKQTLLRQDTKQMDKVQAKYDELYASVQKQVVVAQDIEEVERKVIRRQGVVYEWQRKAPNDVRRLGVSLQAGGGLYQIAKDILYYREKGSKDVSDSGEYQRKDK